ncbi:hypothetical protein B0H14DRAFT_2388215 [Mycena olivaceomarginata]|nr:hypothetical protein B0H14DRAFT_2388215 [Mycena olivaceomarginata]
MVFCIVRISNRTARNRVPELWFEDDNLILHAENTVFRISKGVLAARSSVFGDMLSFPQTVYVSYQSDRAIFIQGVSKVSVGILRVGYEQGLNSSFSPSPVFCHPTEKVRPVMLGVDGQISTAILSIIARSKGLKWLLGKSLVKFERIQPRRSV